jgi:hypothetical protein
LSGNATTATTATTATNANNVNLANRTTNESGHLTFTGTTATGNQPSYTNTNIRVNPAVGGITATSFTGSLSGTATSASRAITSLTSNNIDVSGTSANESAHLTFVIAQAGALPLLTNTAVRVNPSVGGITATSFTGSLSGNATTATTATTATNANNVNIANRTTDESGHIAFIGTTATGNQPVYSNTNIRVNPSTATLSMNGLTVTGTSAIQQILEKATVSATAATGTIAFDVLTQAVLFYTANATGNWTLNVRGNSGTTLNNTMAIGQSITLAFAVTNGATAYYQTGFQIDGSAVTPKWQGGTAPTAGNANSIDVYAVTIIKTANATFTVLESLTRFA